MGLITQEQRNRAMDFAIRINKEKGAGENAEAVNADGIKMSYVGALCEFEYCNHYGGEPNLKVFAGNDGGTDFPMQIYPHGKWREVLNNVKGCTYHGEPTYLLVPMNKCRDAVLYIAVRYHPGTKIAVDDDAELIGWEVGKVLREENFIKNLGGSDNYGKDYKELRKLDELKALTMPPEKVEAVRGKLRVISGNPIKDEADRLWRMWAWSIIDGYERLLERWKKKTA